MEQIRSDVRYAFRALAKSPGFALAVILTLAIGIGANAAIFSMVNAALFQPLPFADSRRIVRIFNEHRTRGRDHINVSYPDLQDFAAHTRTLEGLAGFTRSGLNLAGSGEPERLQAGLTTPGFFEILKLRPVLGRTIAASDVTSDERVAVITEVLWRRRFAARPDIVGQQIILNAQSYTLVGVVPHVPRLPEIWIPLTPTASTLRRNNRFLQAVGRMRAGVTIEQVEAELEGIAGNLEAAYPETNKDFGAQVETLKSVVVDREDQIIFGVLLGFVTLVLAIGCANIANLLLARAGLRQKEMAVRATLGASPARLLRQLLTESLVLAGIGGALGIGLGYAGLQLLLSALPPFVPRLEEMRMDGCVVAYTAGISVLTGLMFGLAPALQLARPNLLDALKQGGPAAGGSSRKRLRNSLAVSQVALALGLLICAGVFLQAFLKMTHIDMGFRPEGVLTFQVTLPQVRYDSDERVAQAYQGILERVKALPGVSSAGITSKLPLGRGNVWRGYMRDGDPVPDRNDSRNALYYAVSPGYLRAMGVPLLAGRHFEPQDEALEPKIAVLNQLLAQRLWPGVNPVGKRIRIHTDEDFPREVVGVVGNTLYDVEDDAEGQIYVPHRQTAWSTMTVAAQTQGDPYALANPAQRAILSLDENLPIYDVRAMADIVYGEVQGFRVLATLMGTLGSVALALAIMGIYGVVSFTVRQRTQEIGVRVALGAQRGDVLTLVLRQGAVLAGTGILIGLGIGIAVNKLLSSGFPEIVAMNPWLILGAAMLLGMIALAACCVPALRATRVSPMEALRYE